MNIEEVEKALEELFYYIQFATVTEIEELQQKLVSRYAKDSYYGIYCDFVIGAIKNVRKEMMK